MVSTRGGARTSGGTAMDQSLRKKPVRKTTTTKSTQTAAKPRTTRAKKPDPVQEAVEFDDDEQDELQEDTVMPAAKPTRRAQAKKLEEEAPKPAKKAATRVKKDEDPAKAPATKPPAKVGRPKGSTKTAKAKPVEGESEKPELPPPTEPKGTRATRATGATTSTAAKGRAPPLSPKKITQVSRAPSRATTATTAKTTATKSTVSKPAPKGRPATRKRNVSDENAEALKLPAKNQALDQDGKHMHDKNPSQRGAGHSEAVEEETVRPTRPITPDEVPESEAEDHAEGTLQNDGAAAESDDDSDSDAPSVDELFGPKTPLKRCSPREATRYTSAQKSLLRMETSMTTPVRRFAVLGTQQGTPQTQKPYCKPSIPMSEVRPMTVARARDRAMVFPKLQPLPMAKDNEDIEDWEESDTPEEQDSNMLAENVATSQSSVLLAGEQSRDDEATPELGDLDETISRMQESELLGSEDGEEGESHANNAPGEGDGGEDLKELERDERDQNIDAAESDLPEYADGLEMNAQNAGTPIISDEIASRNHDDSALAVLREAEVDCNPQDVDVSMEDAPIQDSTPQPETLVWENLQDDVTIPFKFEADLSASRTLPPVEPTERLSIAAALGPGSFAQPDAMEDAKAQQRADDSEMSSIDDAGEQSIARTSVDATANLSDFLDVESLAESGQHQQETANADPKATDSTSLELDAADDDCSPSPVKAPATPARDISELDIALEDIQNDEEFEIPRYARPTIASRRKSLPAIFSCAAVKGTDRPLTAPGASMPRVTVPYGNYLFADFTTPSRVTLARPRPSTAHGLASEKKLRKASQTPITGSPVAKTPDTSVPDTMQISRVTASPSRTPMSRLSHAGTPGTSMPDSTRTTSGERFPGLPSRTAYDLEGTPSTTTPATSKVVQGERFPGLPPQDSYESFAEDTHTMGESPSVRTPKAIQSAVKERYPGLPPSDVYAENLEVPNEERTDEGAPSTPIPATGERYPGLPSKRSYTEHAMTAMPPSRFRTPTQSPVKRPATAQKPASLRKVALKAATPRKTPLKAPTMTPGMEPMTPHPAAPLRGVVALVEVFTSEGGCATPAFTVLLQRLGAKTTKTFSERVTHLVFKEGSPTTLQRLRVHNKQVAETGVGNEIYCVNSRWVSDCDTESRRMDESDEAYAVDVEDVPRAGKRRRKSMEPTSLRNIGGNVVRDRKSTLGRSSLSRTSLKPESPSELDMTPKASVMDKENIGEDGSPATPAYLAAPDSLVQQTAPMNRVRKLDFHSRDSEKNRRLTFFSGEF